MAGQKFSMDDYVDVAERIVEFRTKHPDGSLQQVALDFREVSGAWWVVYTAAAFRTPDDVRPGHGTAWEPVPGKTPYTRDSELQNAETAAWGRAIVAVLAADTKRGIASKQEVQNRRLPEQAANHSADDHASALIDAKIRAVELARKMKSDLPDQAAAGAFVVTALEARGLSKDSVADLVKLCNEWSAA